MTHKTHRSHISSKRAKSRGWSAIPPFHTRVETQNLIEEANIGYMKDEYISLTSTTGAAGTTDTLFIDAGDSIITDTWYTWQQPWVNEGYNNICNQPITVIKEIIKEREVKSVEERTLYRIYVVDPRKGGVILIDGKVVVAKNENEALLKAGVAEAAAKIGRELDQVDVYAEKVGTFIRPRKETQRVRVTKEEED